MQSSKVKGDAEISRRRLLGAAAASALLVSPSVRAQAEGSVRRPPVLNDASRLNPTLVAAHRIVRVDDERRYVEDVRALLREAEREGRPFVSAARGIPWAARACRGTESQRR